MTAVYVLFRPEFDTVKGYEIDFCNASQTSWDNRRHGRY